MNGSVMFTVGHRALELSAEDVLAAVRDVQPDKIRKHYVVIDDGLPVFYPPKQVLAAATGWPNRTFTTQEAQRVLLRLGFVCRTISDHDGGQRTEHVAELTRLVADLTRLVTELHSRVYRLEQMNIDG